MCVLVATISPCKRDPKSRVSDAKKPPGTARKTILQVRLTEDERKILDDAAQAKALDTSAWVRMEAIALAKALLASQSRGS